MLETLSAWRHVMHRARVTVMSLSEECVGSNTSLYSAPSSWWTPLCTDTHSGLTHTDTDAGTSYSPILSIPAPLRRDNTPLLLLRSLCLSIAFSRCALMRMYVWTGAELKKKSRYSDSLDHQQWVDSKTFEWIHHYEICSCFTYTFVFIFIMQNYNMQRI